MNLKLDIVNAWIALDLALRIYPDRVEAAREKLSQLRAHHRLLGGRLANYDYLPVGYYNKGNHKHYCNNCIGLRVQNHGPLDSTFEWEVYWGIPNQFCHRCAGLMTPPSQTLALKHNLSNHLCADS